MKLRTLTITHAPNEASANFNEISAAGTYIGEINEQCKKCFHFQVCANVMKNQLFIREKMLKEENPKCEHFAPAEDVAGVVRCKDCEYLTVHNSPTLYAYCEKTHLRFEPFKTDTRTHFCSYGEKKEG